jgi:hypothetical protein
VQARIAVGGLLVALLLGGAAQAAQSSHSGSATYRFVSITHSSSSSKHDPPFYVGSSSATWSLAPATKDAPNKVQIDTGVIALGLGRVNIRGVYRVQAKTNLKANCHLTAATGSRQYPLVAPGPFLISIGNDPKSSKRLLFVQGGTGGNVHASLSNPYFGTECTTSIAGEPSTDTLWTKSLPKSAFTQKTVVIRFSGSTTKDKIVYRWSTVFTLKRVG